MVRKLIPCVLALLCCTALAGAAPILDGLVTKPEYPVTVNDTYVYGAPDETGMPYYNTGLDIDYVGFDMTADYMYLGLATKQPFMASGSPGSLYGQTGLSIAFYTSMPNPAANPPSSPLWYLTLAVSDNGVEQATLVQNPVGGDRVTMYLTDGFVKVGNVGSVVPSITGKFGVKVGKNDPTKGLEIWLDGTLFSGYSGIDLTTAPYFTLQLDDLGAWPDDQMVGMVPEPATLGLLSLGAAAIIRRRRRA